MHKRTVEVISLRGTINIPPALLKDILDVEDLCFPHPWGPEVFLDELKQDTGFLEVLCERRRHATVLGFCCLRQLYDELHILQIAIHPDARRQGHGATLLSQSLSLAQRQGCRSLVLEVRRSNRPAINLYEKHGFQQVGLRKAYYADNGEDAVVMTCAI